jgi:hypothetical protein
MKNKQIIEDLIFQLIRVTPTLESNLRLEEIKFLTPIEKVYKLTNLPEYTFCVGKETPNGDILISDDLMSPIKSEELFSILKKLPEDVFILRLS